VPTPGRKVRGITRKKAKLIQVWLATATAALVLLEGLATFVETLVRMFGH
jgi:hypothetical protein